MEKEEIADHRYSSIVLGRGMSSMSLKPGFVVPGVGFPGSLRLIPFSFFVECTTTTALLVGPALGGLLVTGLSSKIWIYVEEGGYIQVERVGGDCAYPERLIIRKNLHVIWPCHLSESEKNQQWLAPPKYK
jgi:hypothetical protein